jgi:hypothetical protein
MYNLKRLTADIAGVPKGCTPRPNGLGRAARRGLANMKIQVYLTAAVINLKRLAS